MDFKTRKKIHICRVCLGAVTKKDMSLFQHYMNLPLYTHIISIANVNIKENDGFPDKICSQCLEDLCTAISFKNKCEQNDMILQSNNLENRKYQLSVTVAQALPSLRNSHENKTPEMRKKERIEVEPEEVTSICDGNASQTFDGIDIKSEDQIDLKSKVEEADTQNLFNSTQVMDNPSDAFDYDGEIASKASFQESQLRRNTLNEQVTQKTEGHCQDITKMFDDTLQNYTDDDDDDKYLTEKPVFKTKAIDLHFQCDDCKEFFKTKCKLRVHWKKLHKQTQLICQTCKRDFKTYLAHYRHRKNRPKACIEAAKFHIEGVGRLRIFHCKLCSYKSKLIESMINHNITHTGEKPFTCDLCGASYTQLGSLFAHKESVHGQYKVGITCQYCGKFVKGRNSVDSHLRYHKSKCDIKCEVCKRVMKNERTLMFHMVRHTGIKNEQCDVCDKKFFTSAERSTHKRKIHRRVLLEKKILECDLCSYKCCNESTLIKHKGKHMADNLPCTQCGRFFATLQKLDIHKRRHTEKNYSCEHCDLKFNRGDKLKLHVKRMHKTTDVGLMGSLSEDPTPRSKKHKI